MQIFWNLILSQAWSCKLYIKNVCTVFNTFLSRMSYHVWRFYISKMVICLNKLTNELLTNLEFYFRNWWGRCQVKCFTPLIPACWGRSMVNLRPAWAILQVPVLQQWQQQQQKLLRWINKKNKVKPDLM
jgi:hypothetical protein